MGLQLVVNLFQSPRQSKLRSMFKRGLAGFSTLTQTSASFFWVLAGIVRYILVCILVESTLFALVQMETISGSGGKQWHIPDV